MNETIHHKVEDWLRKSFLDLRASRRLLALIGQDIAAYHVCFLAQQAAEKAVKAALVAEQRPVEPTHDLDALVSALPSDWTVRRALGQFGALTEYAVDTRYPDPRREPTAADAGIAVERAAAIVDAVVRDLRRHGVAVADVGVRQGGQPRP